MRRAVVLAVCLALGAATAAGGASELTGYGARRAVWNAHHKEAKLSFLRAGCCYGPLQDNGQYRYYNVQLNVRIRVFMYDMDFGPRIDEKEARKRIKSELPPDARVVRRVKKKHCAQLDYSSVRAKRAMGQAHIGVEFDADPTAHGSYKEKVQKVAIGTLVTTHEDCGLF